MDEIETDTYADIVDTEQFVDTEFDTSELAPDSAIYTELQDHPSENEHDSEIQLQEVALPEDHPQSDAPAPVGSAPRTEAVRFTRLPLSRIKSIMKMDPAVGLASAEAVFLITKATELFLETIAKEAYSYTAKSKKKTVSKKDLDTVIETVDALCFLDGALDF